MLNEHETKTETVAAPSHPALLRVEVGGMSVNVRGADAREHLESVNRQLAVAKLALHRIASSHGSAYGPVTAEKAIKDMRNV